MAVALPQNQTKLICTIGPASASPAVLAKMLEAGMDVARINFSHGDFDGHAAVIRDLREAARQAGRPLSIMADLPGPKMRIGELSATRGVELQPGAPFVLTTEPLLGNAERASVSFDRLPAVVRKGDLLYLNDGLIQLVVERVCETDVHCRIAVGGMISSRKGLNLPDIDLGISAFTERDRQCLEFALAHGVDAVSQSFVESALDVEAVRCTADALGHDPFVIAKIERSRALEQVAGILEAADGIMIARGDLGVEIPIERMAGVQKHLMRLANLAGKPVITATQMLESMTQSRLPTRAEATDVANAILDGTDGVMLSGESAVGRYPVAAVSMLARIAADIEEHRPSHRVRQEIKRCEGADPSAVDDLLAANVEAAFQRLAPAAVVVRTQSGATARTVTRLRLPVWIFAVTPEAGTCRDLQFSYGVCPVEYRGEIEDIHTFARALLRDHGIRGHIVVVAEGPSAEHPETPSRMGILDLGRA